jgi:hypothetical protein
MCGRVGIISTLPPCVQRMGTDNRDAAGVTWVPKIVPFRGLLGRCEDTINIFRVLAMFCNGMLRTIKCGGLMAASGRVMAVTGHPEG